jgi:hypothetical protein
MILCDRIRRRRYASYSHRGISKGYPKGRPRKMAKTVAARGERPASSTAGTRPHAGSTKATRRTLKTGERDPYTATYR